MDTYGALFYNPHLHMVLKSFQTAAESSLRGPSGYLSAWANNSGMSSAELEEYKKYLQRFLAKANLSNGQNYGADPYARQHQALPMPPLIPIQSVPLFLRTDNTSSQKTETALKGEKIVCFQVGGEFRLCLPQILNTLLRPFTMEQVYEASNELHIFFSRCTSEQLDALKGCGVLPASAASCGLVTKTDAERLCHRLLDDTPEKSIGSPTHNSFKVFHECFGKCKGLFMPEYYMHEEARCIECCDCQGWFTPQTFVCHSHRMLENRTCHWGFDSANWRIYLLLVKHQEPLNKLQIFLEELKLKFYVQESTQQKRKCETKHSYNSSKKIRSCDDIAAELIGRRQAVLHKKDVLPKKDDESLHAGKSRKLASLPRSDEGHTSSVVQSAHRDMNHVSSSRIDAGPPLDQLNGLGDEELVTMMRLALSGGVGNSEEARNKFMEEFVEVVSRRYCSLQTAYSQLYQDYVNLRALVIKKEVSPDQEPGNSGSSDDTGQAFQARQQRKRVGDDNETASSSNKSS